MNPPLVRKQKCHHCGVEYSGSIDFPGHACLDTQAKKNEAMKAVESKFSDAVLKAAETDPVLSPGLSSTTIPGSMGRKTQGR
jgi:hypothetical protein